MPIEQDYFDMLESRDEDLMDSIVAMCGWITRIEDLCIACESAPDFNGGSGGNGVNKFAEIKGIFGTWQL